MRNKQLDLKEIYYKFKKRDEHYRENYHFARSLGLPAWLAMAIKTKPKESHNPFFLRSSFRLRPYLKFNDFVKLGRDLLEII